MLAWQLMQSVCAAGTATMPLRCAPEFSSTTFFLGVERPTRLTPRVMLRPLVALRRLAVGPGQHEHPAALGGAVDRGLDRLARAHELEKATAVAIGGGWLRNTEQAGDEHERQAERGKKRGASEMLHDGILHGNQGDISILLRGPLKEKIRYSVRVAFVRLRFAAPCAC